MCTKLNSTNNLCGFFFCGTGLRRSRSEVHVEKIDFLNAIYKET